MTRQWVRTGHGNRGFLALPHNRDQTLFLITGTRKSAFQADGYKFADFLRACGK
jgi:hypothetical protein